MQCASTLQHVHVPPSQPTCTAGRYGRQQRHRRQQHCAAAQQRGLDSQGTDQVRYGLPALARLGPSCCLLRLLQHKSTSNDEPGRIHPTTGSGDLMPHQKGPTPQLVGQSQPGHSSSLPLRPCLSLAPPPMPSHTLVRVRGTTNLTTGTRALGSVSTSAMPAASISSPTATATSPLAACRAEQAYTAGAQAQHGAAAAMMPCTCANRLMHGQAPAPSPSSSVRRHSTMAPAASQQQCPTSVSPEAGATSLSLYAQPPARPPASQRTAAWPSWSSPCTSPPGHPLHIPT